MHTPNATNDYVEWSKNEILVKKILKKDDAIRSYR